ncbi:MAG: alpha/beta hydrolase [Microbacteriaceae bacterium]|nr:alpha/beta hydrolase [Microbacteriaceae bacterium]
MTVDFALRNVVAAIAVAVLLPIGLTGAASTVASAPVVRSQPTTVAQYYAQRLHWTSCSHGLQCTTLQAPLDWGHLSAGSISLALVRQRATGTKQGSLLMNPGGPGDSGVEFIKDDIDDAVDATLQKHFDIVGFDPRGVGESTPVKCYDDAGMDAYLYAIVPGAIGSAGWITAQKKLAAGFAAACEKNTGPVLAHVDTVSAARDLDLERAVLGDSKLNYLGYSYGTYLGTIYAGLFPDRVGRFVLDGAEDPWLGSSTGPTDTSQEVAFEGDLKAYLKSCLAGRKVAVGSKACAFDGSVTSALASITALLSGVGDHPIRNKDGRMLGAATLATAIFNDLYSPDQWPDLNDLFTRVQRGDASTAFAASDSYNGRNSDGTYADNSYVADFAIECLENGSDDSLSDMRAGANQLKKDAPVLGIYDAYTDIGCGAWPYGPLPFPKKVHAAGANPIVIVGTTGDPATPYADARALAAQLDSGVLVTYHGEGHTAYDRGITCIDHVVDAYFVAGTVPWTDPSCH